MSSSIVSAAFDIDSVPSEIITRWQKAHSDVDLKAIFVDCQILPTGATGPEHKLVLARAFVHDYDSLLHLLTSEWGYADKYPQDFDSEPWNWRNLGKFVFENARAEHDSILKPFGLQMDVPGTL